MKNNNTEILLSINLQEGTVLRKSEKSTKVLSTVTKSTVLSSAFNQHAKSNDSARDADVRAWKWKGMSVGQRVDQMIRTIVGDELHMDTRDLVPNIHYVWSYLD